MSSTYHKEKEMKIIEAMKQLKVIEKRMAKNTAEITQYSSMLSTERPLFDSETEQKKEVASRIQANKDLMQEYLNLKFLIEYSNLHTFVEINGVKYSISALLVIKRTLAKKMLDTYSALNQSAAQGRLRSGMVSPTGDKQVQVLSMYDEKDKNRGLAEWQNLYDNIESRLEVINATSDLVMPEK
jgi:hypothetical protein